MVADSSPIAEVEIDDRLVRALLTAQHPDLASLPLGDPVFGWDNVMLRLGDELAVRLPRRAAAAPLAVKEHRWLPTLASLLPLAVPVPLRVGAPTAGFPWAWSVCPWLPGSTWLRTPPADLDGAARVLGGFLRALHRPAPEEAPLNPFRGVPLVARDDVVRARIEQVGDEIDTGRVRERWSEAASVPAWQGPPLWLHGDLHPGNVVVHEDKISAVIDFGDLAAGDPATDLSIGWMVLPADARLTLREAAGEVDDDTWARARGWAVAFGVMMVSGFAGNPAMQEVGRSTLRAALTDA